VSCLTMVGLEASALLDSVESIAHTAHPTQSHAPKRKTSHTVTIAHTHRCLSHSHSHSHSRKRTYTKRRDSAQPRHHNSPAVSHPLLVLLAL